MEKCHCLEHSGLETCVKHVEEDIDELKGKVKGLEARLDTSDKFIARTVARVSGYIAGVAMVAGVVFKLIGKYL